MVLNVQSGSLLYEYPEQPLVRFLLFTDSIKALRKENSPCNSSKGCLTGSKVQASLSVCVSVCKASLVYRQWGRDVEIGK